MLNTKYSILYASCFNRLFASIILCCWADGIFSHSQIKWSFLQPIVWLIRKCRIQVAQFRLESGCGMGINRSYLCATQFKLKHFHSTQATRHFLTKKSSGQKMVRPKILCFAVRIFKFGTVEFCLFYFIFLFFQSLSLSPSTLPHPFFESLWGYYFQDFHSQHLYVPTALPLPLPSPSTNSPIHSFSQFIFNDFFLAISRTKLI